MDNAPAHQKSNKNIRINAKLQEVAACGWTINFFLHPSNSTDMNMNDPAFFCVMQSLQHTKPLKNIDEFIVNATRAFLDYLMDLCKKVWTQLVMNKTIQCNGGNTYMLLYA